MYMKTHKCASSTLQNVIMRHVRTYNTAVFPVLTAVVEEKLRRSFLHKRRGNAGGTEGTGDTRKAEHVGDAEETRKAEDTEDTRNAEDIAQDTGKIEDMDMVDRRDTGDAGSARKMEDIREGVEDEGRKGERRRKKRKKKKKEGAPPIFVAVPKKGVYIGSPEYFNLERHMVSVLYQSLAHSESEVLFNNLVYRSLLVLECAS